MQQDLFAKAASLLASQSRVPTSPGAMTNDGPLLCSAAAIVFQAASETLPDIEARQLAETMVTSPTEFILDRADKLGLDRTMVAQHMLTNDSFPDDERQSRMTALLRAQAQE
jgi:hypothetical protein